MAVSTKPTQKSTPIMLDKNKPFPAKDVAFVIAVNFDGTQRIYHPSGVNAGRLQRAHLKRAKAIKNITASSWVAYERNPICVAYVSSDGTMMEFWI